jgi:hypothetical protein
MLDRQKAAAQVDGAGIVKLLRCDVHQRRRVRMVHNASGKNRSMECAEVLAGIVEGLRDAVL